MWLFVFGNGDCALRNGGSNKAQARKNTVIESLVWVYSPSGHMSVVFKRKERWNQRQRLINL